MAGLEADADKASGSSSRRRPAGGAPTRRTDCTLVGLVIGLAIYNVVRSSVARRRARHRDQHRRRLRRAPRGRWAGLSTLESASSGATLAPGSGSVSWRPRSSPRSSAGAVVFSIFGPSTTLASRSRCQRCCSRSRHHPDRDCRRRGDDPPGGAVRTPPAADVRARRRRRRRRPVRAVARVPSLARDERRAAIASIGPWATATGTFVATSQGRPSSPTWLRQRSGHLLAARSSATQRRTL